MPCDDVWDLPWLTHVGSMAIARKHAFSNDQWVIPGMNPLGAHYLRAGKFMSDSSEMVFPEACARGRATMKQSLSEIPAKAFTHAWLVGLPPDKHPSRAGFVRVWQGPTAAVYRITGELPRTSSD
jgi:hypothetical protein